MTSAISVNNLSYRYPDGTLALDQVSFNLDYGEKATIMGSNGAGKTTLLHLLNGLLPPREGTIELAGKPLTIKTRRQLHRHVGFVFQNPDHQLFCPTLLEDVRFGPVNMGLPQDQVDAAAKSALERTGLWHKRNKEPWRLSYGERKRGALAAVLSMNPNILMLDEPSAFLDVDAAESLERILRELDITMILVTQNLHLAYTVCQRGLYLHDGQLVTDQPLNTMLSRHDLFQSGQRAWQRQMQMGKSLGWSEDLNID